VLALFVVYKMFGSNKLKQRCSYFTHTKKNKKIQKLDNEDVVRQLF